MVAPISIDYIANCVDSFARILQEYLAIDYYNAYVLSHYFFEIKLGSMGTFSEFL